MNTIEAAMVAANTRGRDVEAYLRIGKLRRRAWAASYMNKGMENKKRCDGKPPQRRSDLNR